MGLAPVSSRPGRLPRSNTCFVWSKPSFHHPNQPPMTHIEEQKILHAIAGMAQSINTILELVIAQRAKGG